MRICLSGKNLYKSRLTNKIPCRHLVLNKDQERPARSRKHDKIRYQYDEHYFLTDPDEMIQEFWAKEAEWQLLDVSITLEEFEAMPFVR